MAITKTREKVRDGFLGDLPEDLQSKVMNIHKLIKDSVRATLEDSNYADLKESKWAMSCIDEFCVMPKDKSDVGSIRVYKNGKTFRCMIQATGHFRNHQYGWIEELLHDFIKNVYATVRPQIRRKYDMTITNEGRTGQPYEGFDIYPNPKSAKDIWDRFDDKKTKTITEEVDDGEIEFSQELADYYECCPNMSYDDYFYERSHGKLKYDFRRAYDYDTGNAVKIVYSLDDIKVTAVGSGSIGNNASQKEMDDAIKDIQKNIKNKGNMDHASRGQKIVAIIDRVTGKKLKSINTIGIFAPGVNHNLLELNIEDLHKFYNEKGADFIKRYVNRVSVGDIDNSSTFKTTHWFKNSEGVMKMRGGYQVKSDNSIRRGTLGEALKHGRGAKMNDIVDNDQRIMVGEKPTYHHPSKKDIRDNPSAYKKESGNTPEYNVDMTEAEAKKTLRTLSQTIINDTANKKDYKVSQYTANIYANIITKNLLPLWAKGFRKFSITLDSYQSFYTFEFKTPPMTQDFVSRFVAGRESINGFIHRNAEIKVKMSPRIFHTMKNPDDAFNFFKAAIKYYDGGLEKASERLMVEVMRLNREMKHLISTTKLSGIVTYPMSLLFVFDDVHMDTKDTFRISSDDIKTINQFVKGIYTKYASPDKERRKIVEDVKDMVKALRECCDPDNETVKDLRYLPEAVENYLFGGYDNEIKEFNEKWICEQLDTEWSRKQTNGQVQYLQEKFGVKKLKKIPTDLVAYITIETESIKDANDKMMISSYCLGKIEIVEWYIELLDVGSKKYIVPHTKPYLESVRTQLLACFKKIMDTPIPKNNRPLIDIQYPKGYEG